MGLKDIGAKLPPGFRFHPSDEELVCHYLRNKISPKFYHHHDGHEDDHHHHDEAEDHLKIIGADLLEIDLHNCEPWQLPEAAKLNAKEWYFFSFRDRKYATGYRANRATVSGYWKATGKDRIIIDPGGRQDIVGMRKTLVFYKNRAPNGIKTAWIMHEFRLQCPLTSCPKEDWVLCRVFNKSKDSHSQVNNYNYALLPSSSSPHSTTIHQHHQHQHLEYQDQTVELPCGWEQMIGHNPPLSSSDYPHGDLRHHDQDQKSMNSIPCGWGQLPSSFSHGRQDQESLMNLLYNNGVINGSTSTECCDDRDSYKNMFPDMGLEKPSMGSSSSDGLMSDRIHLDNYQALGFEMDMDNTAVYL